MNPEYLLDIVLRGVGIPDTLGVDDHDRAKFTAVQAAGGIDAGFFQADFLGAALHVIAKCPGPLGGAAAAGMLVGADVGTAEQMGRVIEAWIVGHRL